MSLDNLPSDICVDILSRLPPKTLIRCTSLSKKYKSLIISPDFLQAHITRNTTIANNNNKSQIFLRFSLDDFKKKDKFVFEPQLDDYPLSGFVPPSLLDDNNTNENVKSLLVEAGLEAPINSCSARLNIVGSINGVICLSDDYRTYTDVYILWNPSIRKWLKLPKPLVTFSTHGPHDQACGFGFDPVTNDYKVVRLVQQHLEDTKNLLFVEVYSLNSGCWKMVEASSNMRYQDGLVRTPCYCLQGIVHWISYEYGDCGRDQYHAIVTFNLSSEVFGIIELPECLINGEPLSDYRSSREYVNKEIVEYKGMLSVSKNESDSHSRICCIIWVMKEYGVVESWSKMFHLTYPVEMIWGWTHIFGNNGEIIMPLRWREVQRPWNDFGSAAEFFMHLHRRDNPVDKVVFLENTGNIERVVGHMIGNGYHIARYVESMVLFDAGRRANRGSPEKSSN